MRYLVDEYFGTYNARLRIRLLSYPLRELVIEISGGSIDTDMAQAMSEKIAHATNFVKNDTDPWNNLYE